MCCISGSVSVCVCGGQYVSVCLCCVFLCLSVSSLCVIHLSHSISLPFLPSSVPFIAYLQSFISPDRVNNSKLPNQCACLTKRVCTVGGIRRRPNVQLWLLALLHYPIGAHKWLSSAHKWLSSAVSAYLVHMSGYPVHISAYPAHVSCVHNALPEAKVVF